MNNLTFETNNRIYSVFKSINIFKSMNSISGGFVIVFPDFEKRINDIEIKNGGSCILRIDNKKIITGYIDQIRVTYNNDYHNIIITGRDKTEDLVDCNYSGTENEWKNRTVFDIIKRLCSPFSISVENLTTKSLKTIETFKISDGEFVGDSILRLCSDYGILPLADETGNLSLTESGTTYCYDAIELGQNSNLIEVIESNKTRYGTYTIKGYGIGGDLKSNLSDFLSLSGQSTDSAINRNRTITIYSEVNTTSGNCSDKATWIKNINAGKSRKTISNTIGWTQTNNDLWEINKIVRIKNNLLNIDKNMLISEVNYRYTESEGHIAIMTIVDKNTYTNNSATIKGLFDD